MLKTFLAYAAAGLVGFGAPVLVRWIANNSPVGSNPVWSALAVVAALGVVAAVLAALLPARWLTIAVVVAAPLCVMSLVTFAALLKTGAFFWVWIGLAVGSVAAALAGALLGARRKAA